MQAVIDPHPRSRDLALHKFHCANCGPIRTEILSLGRVTQPDAAGIQARKSPPVLQHGETAEAQIVLTAQQLLRSHPAALYTTANRTRGDYFADILRGP